MKNILEQDKQKEQKLIAIKLLVGLILGALLLSIIIFFVSINQQKNAINEFLEEDLIKVSIAYKYKDIEYIKYKIHESKPDLEDFQDYMMFNNLSEKDLKVEQNNLIFNINEQRCLIIKRKIALINADFFINEEKISKEYKCNKKLKGKAKITFL